MRLLLTGATGAGGLNVYRAALIDPTVTSVTLLLRREMPSWAILPPNAAEKTTTIIHSDFASYPPDISLRLAQHDACIWALGTSSNGAKEEDYTLVTHDYPMAMIRALSDAGVGKDRPADKPFRCVYFSSMLADPTEESSLMWARIKGRTEKDLAAFCAENPGMKAHCIRPAFFAPSRDHPQDRKHQRGAGKDFLDSLMGLVLRVAVPSLYTPIPEMNAAALAIAQGKYPDQEVFENSDLRQIAKELGVKV